MGRVYVRALYRRLTHHGAQPGDYQLTISRNMELVSQLEFHDNETRWIIFPKVP
jgi:hypothetical protein